MIKQNDNDSLRKFQQSGDQKAFQSLVEKYAPIVHGAALRRVGSHDLAQDVTQKVFITLAQKARSIKAGTPLIGWLHQVTRNTTIDFIRSETARKSREKIYSMDPSLTEESNEAQWQDISPILEASLDDLSRDDRNAILLRYFEGSSLNAIATSQGVSPDAARKRVARALEKVRQSLSRKGVTASALTITSSIQAHGSTSLTPTHLAQLKVASTAAIPAASLATKLLLMNTKTKLAAGALALIGVTVITTQTINNKIDEKALTTSDMTEQTSAKSTQRSQSAQIKKNQLTDTISESSALDQEGLYIDPKALQKSRAFVRMMSSLPIEQMLKKGSSTQINPKAKTYGLSETLSTALQAQLDNHEEKRFLSNKLALDVLFGDKDRAEEFLSLLSMTEHEKFTPAHLVRLKELYDPMEKSAEEAQVKAGLSQEDLKNVKLHWFDQPGLIDAVKNELPSEDYVALDELVETQRQINREKVAFDRSQELAKDLGLTIEQRESLYASLYENAEESPEQIASILTPTQMETYSAKSLSQEATGLGGMMEMMAGE